MSAEKVSNDLKEHVTDGNVWMRLLFMLLFSVVYCVAKVVLAAVIVFQFFCVLFSGDKNQKVLALGRQLSTFVYQLLSYLTFNSEVRPFPFDVWPSDAVLSGTAQAEKKTAPARKRAPAKKKAPATAKVTPKAASKE